MKTIEETIYVRDAYGVRSQAYVKGQQVEDNVYDSILATNKKKPEPPITEKAPEVTIETKVLPKEDLPPVEEPTEEVVEDVLEKEDEVKEETPKPKPKPKK